MKQLIEQVNGCVLDEYGRASTKFGRVNNSDHESYAIMLEECEESEQELEAVRSFLRQFWTYVRADDRDIAKLQSLKSVEHHAVLAACELIQVAAMAHKASMTIYRRNVAGAGDQEGSHG